MRIYLKCPHCNNQIELYYETFPEGLLCGVQCERCWLYIPIIVTEKMPEEVMKCPECHTPLIDTHSVKNDKGEIRTWFKCSNGHMWVQCR